MERKLPRLIGLLLLGSAAASSLGMLISAGGVGLAYHRVNNVEVEERARVMAQGIAEAINLGSMVALLLLPLGWWWAVRRWQRED